MKKILVIVVLSLLSLNVFASEDKKINTLFTGESDYFHVFGGPAFKLVFLNGKSHSFFGGGGGHVFDNNITIGGSGHATIPDYEKNGNKYHFGYTGVELGYFMFEKEAVSLWPRFLVGPGYVYIKDSGEPWNWYFVLEPGVDINFNITGHTRVTIGCSYLSVIGDSINDNNLTGEEYSGFSLNFAVRFLI